MADVITKAALSVFSAVLRCQASVRPEFEVRISYLIFSTNGAVCVCISDYCRSILRDGRGAAFVPSPASGELLPFGYQVIEITGYSDMWGEYRDFLICKVNIT